MIIIYSITHWLYNKKKWKNLKLRFFEKVKVLKKKLKKKIEKIENKLRTNFHQKSSYKSPYLQNYWGGVAPPIKLLGGQLPPLPPHLLRPWSRDIISFGILKNIDISDNEINLLLSLNTNNHETQEVIVKEINKKFDFYNAPENLNRGKDCDRDFVDKDEFCND